MIMIASRGIPNHTADSHKVSLIKIKYWSHMSSRNNTLSFLIICFNLSSPSTSWCIPQIISTLANSFLSLFPYFHCFGVKHDPHWDIALVNAMYLQMLKQYSIEWAMVLLLMHWILYNRWMLLESWFCGVRTTCFIGVDWYPTTCTWLKSTRCATMTTATWLNII